MGFKSCKDHCKPFKVKLMPSASPYKNGLKRCSVCNDENEYMERMQELTFCPCCGTPLRGKSRKYGKLRPKARAERKLVVVATQ